MIIYQYADYDVSSKIQNGRLLPCLIFIIGITFEPFI